MVPFSSRTYLLTACLQALVVDVTVGAGLAEDHLRETVSVSA